MQTNSLVFVHKSDKGALTVTFNYGDTAVTCFAEDIAEAPAKFLKENLSDVKTSEKDGKVRKYRMSNQKLAVTFEPQGEVTKDEFGRANARAIITGLAPAPNHLSDITF